VTWRLDRRTVSIIVVLAWVAGIFALVRRRHDVPETELLARGVLHLEPITYFYSVSQGPEQIGWASSAIDTSETGFQSSDAIHLRRQVAGDTESIVATSVGYLSRRFTLDSFKVAFKGGNKSPLHLASWPPAGAGVLLPTLAPIALMLTHEPRVGSSVVRSVYNPLSRRIERVTLSIAAESLFSVVDSAAFDSTRHSWLPAHADTVRSWKLVTPSGAISAWVDSQGRIVSAIEPGGAGIRRTAYEIATLNPKLRTH
jgi:hypothetical protein